MPYTHSKSRRNFLKTTALAGGAAGLGACAASPTSSSSNSAAAATYKHIPSFYPKHNERTISVKTLSF